MWIRAPGHPHVRGDYAGITVYRLARIRVIPTCVGTTVDPLRALETYRVIPTCVGTTLPFLRGEGGGPGHPHVRGDYSNVDDVAPSSKRVIPTCVGTTRIFSLAI